MAVTSIRGNDVSANGANVTNLLAQLHKQTVSLSNPVATKYGVLSVNSTGQLVFQPGTLSAKLGAGKKITESIKLTVNTDTGPQQIQVTYSVIGENDGPTATNDVFVLSNGKAGGFSVLKNDFDIDVGDRVSVTGVINDESAVSFVKGAYSTITKHGVLSVTSAGAVKFVVDARYASLAFTDTVSYQISDGKGGFDTASLDVSNNGGSAAARPGRLDMATIDDKGVSNIDNITSSQSATISGFSLKNQDVKVFNNGVFVGTATADSSGRFSLSDVGLSAGSNSITAQVTDPAGVELLSAPLVVTADYEAPSVPVNLALAEIDDTGFSSTDGQTSKTSGLTLTGTAEPSTQVVIYDGEKILNTTTSDVNGAFSVDVSLAQGVHELVAKSIDKAGNQSIASEGRTITVVAPPSVDFKPVISAVTSETGVVSATAATNDVTPTLTISLGKSLPDGALIEVFDANISLGYATGSGTSFTFTPASPLTQGSHDFTARVVDIAGSKGPVSVVRSVEIDTTAPNAPGKLDLAAPDDTGRSAIDNITNRDADLTVTATVASGTTAADITIYEWIDSDGNDRIDQDELSVVSPVILSISGASLRADLDLADGAHALLLTQKDKAGNESVPEQNNLLTIVVDTAAPEAPTDLSLADADDTGVSDSDGVTSHIKDLTVSGNAEAFSQVELYRVVNGREVSLGKVLATESGAFSLDIALPEGATDVQARTTDIAGNRSESAAVPLSITIDTKAPIAPVLTGLATVDDTGRSDSDRITKQTSDLTFNGTAEAGSTVEVFKVDAGVLTSLGNATVTGTSFTIDLSLDEGVQQLVAKSTDAAGNISTSSAALKVTIDTTAPAAINSLNLLASDDTGASNTDNVTSNTAGLTFNATVATGTAAADVNFYEWADTNQNGVVDAGEYDPLSTTDISGLVVNGTTYTANLTLSVGSHNLIATQKDAAGNESALDAANVFNVVIDNVAPTQVATIDTASQLNSSQVTVGGVLSAPLATGDVIQVWNGSVLLGQAAIGDDDTWSFNLNKTGSIKTFNLTTQVVDLAGNIGQRSDATTVTLGTDGDDVINGSNSIKEFIFGLDGNDVINGGTGTDLIFGGAGNDRIKGGDGNDQLDGGAGNDILEGENGIDVLKGASGNDILRGGNDIDFLYGGADSDRLIGGAGDDFLNGGSSADTFTGGDGSANEGGNDTFQILDGDGILPPGSTATADVASLIDQITDYSSATDTIDLDGLVVDERAAAGSASYGAALTSANNELRNGADSSFQYLTTTSSGLFGSTTTDAGISYLFINANGDLSPDQVIQITGVGAAGL